MIRGILLLCTVVAALVIVGAMDHEDERRQVVHACDMIEAGAWPTEVAPYCEDRDNDH